MATCPRCGSDAFHYELRSGGTKSKTNSYRTGIKGSWIVPAGRKKLNSDRKQKTIGFCPDCGYKTDKPLPVQRQQTGTATPQATFHLSPGVKKGLLIWLVVSLGIIVLAIVLQATGALPA